MIKVSTVLGSLALVIFVSLSAHGQEVIDINEYDDFRVMLMDEEYEKLVKKSVAITENDKRRREPMPYLFAAMAYFEISKDEKFDEDHPKAFDLSLKYAGKYRQKDKGGDYVDANKDFIDELRGSAMEVGENYVEEENWSKAKRYYKYITKFDPTDPGAWLMRGYTEIKGNDRTGAKNSFEKYNSIGLDNFNDYDSDQQRLVKYGIITYSEHLFQNGMRDSCTNMMNAGNRYLGEDTEFQMYMKDFN